jgi:hypothetical protein
LEAADEEETGLGGGGDFEPDEEADFFEAEEFGGDEKMVAEAGGFEVVDFGAGDDGDESGAAHLFEGPAEGGGELGAGDFDHAEVGDVVDDSAGVGVEVVDFEGDGDAGLGGERGAHVKTLAEGEILTGLTRLTGFWAEVRSKNWEGRRGFLIGRRRVSLRSRDGLVERSRSFDFAQDDRL